MQSDRILNGGGFCMLFEISRYVMMSFGQPLPAVIARILAKQRFRLLVLHGMLSPKLSLKAHRCFS